MLKFTSHWWFNSISHMKRLLILGIGLAVLLSASLVSHAAQTAQARIFCLSLRLQRGPDMFDLSALDLSTISLDTPNGELAPTFDTPSHFSGFRISDPDTGEVVEEGEIDLDTPAFAEAPVLTVQSLTWGLSRRHGAAPPDPKMEPVC
ncbi:MAG: hypothetical protein DME19_20335 [Verrucomicrobia bacterium]|nr:MAG: hypothetical protein DME19_20335 [Verrucomicrobiota bacterium]